MVYKTHGIIIKRTNLGEADRIVTLFSEKFGKVKAIAKGIRKINSRLSGNVELFCLTNFNIAEGRNLDVVTGAEIEKCYFALRSNLSSTREAYYFGELIDKLTEENSNHPEIYHLLDEALEYLNSIESKILVPYFELNLLSELGYKPELEKCVVCRKKINENEQIYFNFSHAGIICDKCQKGDIIVSADVIKLMRLFLRHSIIALQKIELQDKIIKDTEKIIRIYLTHISDKDFKSQKFLK